MTEVEQLTPSTYGVLKMPKSDREHKLEELLRLIVVDSLRDAFELTPEEALMINPPVSGWEYLKHLQEAARILNENV
jgi:hypothetical protein